MPKTCCCPTGCLSSRKRWGVVETHGCPARRATLSTWTNRRGPRLSIGIGMALSRRCSDTTPGIVLRKYRGQWFLEIDGRVWVRFKRLDNAYLSRNQPTPQSLAWNAQKALPLSNIPQVDRLEFGYIPDIAGTQVLRAYILRRLEHSVDWLWQVWGQKDDKFPYATMPGGTDAFGKVGYAYHDFSV